MDEHAILASNRETVTPWVAETVMALGYEVTATAAADRPENGQYYLSPDVVERAAQSLERTGASLLVVDGEPHLGQQADLRERFPDTALHDRRSAVWDRLAPSNPVAGDQLALRRARLDRRLAERTQRGQRQQSPDGTSGRVADLDSQCDRVRDRLSDRRQTARHRIATSHTDADADVVMASPVGTDSPVSRRLLLDRDSVSADALPLRAETDGTRVGVHDVAVTDLPPIPSTDQLPDWFEAVVPGAIAALERADIVCSDVAALATTLSARFDAATVTPEPSTGAAVRRALSTQLGTVDIAVSFPYTDEAHAAVSRLHDRTDVRDVAYDERIELSATVPESAVGAVERRIREAGGRVERLPTPEDDA
jgi:50S ribosomal subunit-associated GTPase HflX